MRWWGGEESRESPSTLWSPLLPLAALKPSFATCELCDHGRSLHLYALLIPKVGMRLLPLQSWQMDRLTLEVGGSPKPVPSPPWYRNSTSGRRGTEDQPGS